MNQVTAQTEILKPSNEVEYIILMIIAGIVAIVCFWIWSRAKNEHGGNQDESTNTEIKLQSEINLCKSRIDELGRELKELREHLDYLMSKHSDSTAEIVDRIASVNEKIASLNTLMGIIKERFNKGVL